MAATALSIWNRLNGSSAGRWLFAQVICRKAPYFSTIRPRFSRLEPGVCEVGLRKRRAVENHIGTIHAIAMCNLAELAGGLAMDATLPATHRWIPKGMTVVYLKVATTDLTATARCNLPASFGDAEDIVIPVDVKNTEEAIVFRALITMHVTRRKSP